MASYVVDGLVLPVSVGGHPVLDFCNTRAGWGAATPKEYLRSYDHLARWTVENGLLSVAGPDGGVLDRALALREALYAVLVRGEDAWSVINDEVRAAMSELSLVGADLPTSWQLSTSDPLAAIAWSAAQFLTSPAAAQVGACPGEGCGWTFTDPRGRRRWCSMAWCGNRAKARRHAARSSPPH